MFSKARCSSTVAALEDREPEQYWHFCPGQETRTRGRGAHGEVVSQQLHDEGAVFERVFIQCVKLCNSLIKSLTNTNIHNKQYLTSAQTDTL